MNTNISNTITYAEFCSGIGGFRLGLSSSNFPTKCVYKNEIDPKCEKTYALNFKETFDSHDIFDINIESLPDFDMLCAGFPCQPFSIAGKQNGFLDERGLIFNQLLKIIKTKVPSIVFLENVANLIHHNKGKTFKYMKSSLENLGYTVNYKILDSSNFSIPQKRPRIYIVAFNNNMYSSINFKFPIGTSNNIAIRDILCKNSKDIPISDKWKQYIDLYTNKLKIEDLSFDVPKTRRNLERISNNCVLSDCILQIRSSGIRAYSLDDCFPTFAVSNSGGGAMIPVLTKEKRHINVKEIQRIMGFPNDFTFNVSRTDSIKQLANAVCPPVITAVFEEIVSSLQNSVTRQKCCGI